jgi:hypothetical protein
MRILNKQNGFILLIILISTLLGCEGARKDRVADEPITDTKQVNITIINSTSEKIENITLNTNYKEFNQNIDIAVKEQFQTSFPLNHEKKIKINMEYTDNDNQKRIITFPESSFWIDHDSIVFVVELTKVSEEGVYSYRFFANEDEYHNK